MKVQMCITNQDRMLEMYRLFTDLGYTCSGPLIRGNHIIAIDNESRFFTVRPFFIKGVRCLTTDTDFFKSIELLKATVSLEAVEQFIFSSSFGDFEQDE